MTIAHSKNRTRGQVVRVSQPIHRRSSPSRVQRTLGLTLAAGLRAFAATWRMHTSGLEFIEHLGSTRQQHILAFWHRHYLSIFPLVRSRSTVALTNQTFRGQVIAEICRRTDVPVMQINRHGLHSTLAGIRSHVDPGIALGVTIDGPLGPAGEVKPAFVRLAQRLTWPVVPVSVASRPAFVLKNRWDRLEIPLPLATIQIVIGEPICISTTDQAEHSAVRLKSSLDQGTDQAKRYLASRTSQDISAIR